MGTAEDATVSAAGWPASSAGARTVNKTAQEHRSEASTPNDADPADAAAGMPRLQETLDRIEREMIVDALKAARGNKAKAARLLGITERVMGLRVQKHGISPKDYRSG